jgi:hypothetical protein
LADTTPQVVVIGSTGDLANVRTLPVAPGAYNVGDVDEAGQLWVAYNGRNWVQINLATNAVVASGTANPAISIYDWAYVPGGGNYLYAIAVDTLGLTYLYRFDRGPGKAFSQVGLGYGLILPANGVVGAVYAGTDGFLYGSENSGGRVYRFSLNGNTATLITTGPTASSNDGAHCILNST